MTLPEKYAHDYRDMAMSEEELRKMLEEFADEIRKERVTHCDDINCPECPKAAYEAGVKEGAKLKKKIVAVTANEKYLFKVYEDGNYNAIRI